MSQSKEIDFGFNPYPEQQKVMNALSEGYKRFYLVWTRRAGKDRVWFNILIEEAMRRVGTYVYAFTTVKQAKLAMWKTIDMKGKTPFDYIPKELIYKINEADMTITLRNPNDLRLPGSLIKVTSTHDGGRSLRGGNYMGVILSEYAFMDPNIYSVVTSSLILTMGWIALITTVSGHNHAYKLWNSTVGANDWYNSYETCETYLDCLGQRVISAEAIQREISSGAMSQAKVNQEFYCDFDAAVEGAVFSHEIDLALQTGRLKEFAVGKMPVSMFFDIGINKSSGSTAIWFVQFLPDDTVNFVDYFECSDQPAVFYTEYIKNWMGNNGATRGKCYLPHDSLHRDKIECNTYAKTYREQGLDVVVIPRIERKAYAIEFSRQEFKLYTIHSKKCDRGIQALREYNWDTLNTTHWANHAVDAFLAVGQFLNLRKNKEKRTYRPIANHATLASTSAF